jgi:hypothetical protein
MVDLSVIRIHGIWGRFIVYRFNIIPPDDIIHPDNRICSIV